jgi:Universal stress protein family.
MATSKPYKHILLATDLSDRSTYIAKRAAEIAKLTKAKLSVIHVLGHSPIAYAGEFSIPIDTQFEVQIQNEASKQLEKL